MAIVSVAACLKSANVGQVSGPPVDRHGFVNPWRAKVPTLLQHPGARLGRQGTGLHPHRPHQLQDRLPLRNGHLPLHHTFTPVQRCHHERGSLGRQDYRPDPESPCQPPGFCRACPGRQQGYQLQIPPRPSRKCHLPSPESQSSGEESMSSHRDDHVAKTVCGTLNHLVTGV